MTPLSRPDLHVADHFHSPMAYKDKRHRKSSTFAFPYKLVQPANLILYGQFFRIIY